MQKQPEQVSMHNVLKLQ